MFPDNQLSYLWPLQANRVLRVDLVNRVKEIPIVNTVSGNRAP